MGMSQSAWAVLLGPIKLLTNCCFIPLFLRLLHYAPTAYLIHASLPSKPSQISSVTNYNDEFHYNFYFFYIVSAVYRLWILLIFVWLIQARLFELIVRKLRPVHKWSFCFHLYCERHCRASYKNSHLTSLRLSIHHLEWIIVQLKFLEAAFLLGFDDDLQSGRIAFQIHHQNGFTANENLVVRKQPALPRPKGTKSRNILVYYLTLHS